MLGSLILYLKGMRIMMFQLSGFYYKAPTTQTPKPPNPKPPNPKPPRLRRSLPAAWRMASSAWTGRWPGPKRPKIPESALL